MKWNNEWWFSGVFFKLDDTKEIVRQEKSSQSSLNEVNFWDSDSDKVQEFLKLQYQAFLAFNNGSSIAFMHKDKMESFCNEYLAFYHKWLKLSKKELEKVKEGHVYKGLISTVEFNLKDYTDYGLVFLNPASGIEMGFGINDAFLMDNNPCFDESGTEMAMTILLADKSISTELVYFAIENGIDKLPFFKSDLGNLFLSEIDFLFRFWKQENYLSKPSVSVK